MFGMLLNIIKNINKSIKKSARNARNRLELARAKQSGEDEVKKVKKEQAQRSKPTLGSAIMVIFSKAAGAIEAIPVTLVSIKIIAIILAIAIFATILFSALSALSSMLLESTIAEASTSLGFTNPYLQSISQEQYVGEDGAFHTIIRKVVDSDDDDDNGGDDPPGPTPEIYTTDVELWLNLTDKQIYSCLEAAGYLDTKQYSSSEFIYAANWLRAVRMAYRICYATESGVGSERVFRGIEPEVLLGIMPFEKGVAWMGLSGDYTYGDTTSWKYFASNTSISGDSLYEKLFRDNSIDNHYSDLFNRKDESSNFLDGPYSYTYFSDRDNFDEWFIEGLTSRDKYMNAYDSLLMYPEYSGFDKFLPSSGSSSFSTSGVAIKTLFYSMFFLAMNYDSGFANGGVKYWNGSLAEDEESGAFTAGSYNMVNQYIYNTSSMFWDQVDEKYRYGADEESGDIIGVMMCNLLGYSSVKEIPFKNRYSFTKQVINCLYYSSFHHIPDFGAYYESTVAPSLGFTYTDAEDYYAAIMLLTIGVISEGDGNVNNWGLKEVRETHNVSKWKPWGSATRDTYKHVGSCIYTDDIYSETDYGLGSMEDGVSTPSSTGNATLFVNTDSVFEIDSSKTSLMNYIIFSKYGGTHSSNFIGTSKITDFIEPLTFSSQCGQYHNLHNMNVEGFISVIAGGDISYQTLSFILEYSGSSVQPVDPPAETGIIADDYLLSTVLSKAEPILMGGSARTINSKGGFTSTSQRMYLPLVDMDNTKDGYNGFKGNGDGNANNNQGYDELCIVQPMQQYMSGGAHNGLDFFGIGNAGTTGKSDEMTSVFSSYAPYTKNNWIDSASFHNADAFKDGTTKSERTGIVSIADGYIVRVHFNKTTSDFSDGWCLGNCVFVRYQIMCGTSIKELTIAYAHMSPDMMLVLSESLEAQGVDSSPIVEAYLDGWDGNNVEKQLTGIEIPVKQGTLLGFAGLTGATDGSHLHFAAYTSDTSLQMWETSYGAFDYGALTSYMLLGAMAYGKEVDSTMTYPICYSWVNNLSSGDLAGFGNLNITTGSWIKYYLHNLPTAIAEAKNHPTV